MFDSSAVIALYPDGHYKPYALEGYYNRDCVGVTMALPYEYFLNIQENIKMFCGCRRYEIFLSEANIYIFTLDKRLYSKESRACVGNPRILDVSDKNFVQIQSSSIYAEFSSILYALDNVGCIWFMDLKSGVSEFSQMFIPEYVNKFEITVCEKSLILLSDDHLYRYHLKTKNLEFLRNDVSDFFECDNGKILMVDTNGNLIIDNKSINLNITKIVGRKFLFGDICYISDGILKLYQTGTPRPTRTTQIDLPNLCIINAVVPLTGFLCQGSDNHLYLVEETGTTIISSEIDGCLEPLKLMPKFSTIKSANL